MPLPGFLTEWWIRLRRFLRAFFGAFTKPILPDFLVDWFYDS
jgi:hypothetical protein